MLISPRAQQTSSLLRAGGPLFCLKYSSEGELLDLRLGVPRRSRVSKGGRVPKPRGGKGSASKLWNPILAAKSAARMGHPSVREGEKTTCGPPAFAFLRRCQEKAAPAFLLLESWAPRTSPVVFIHHMQVLTLDANQSSCPTDFIVTTGGWPTFLLEV